MTLTEAGTRLLPELVALRRELHADPEVGLDLPRTRDRVLAALDGLGLEITLGKRTTSVVAVLRGARPGPTVLLRGDMDALPVAELTGLDFASTNGAMHACGHDLHVAGLVGAARLLADRREEIAGNVIFMFQPGEEGCGGAKIMLEEGLLDVAGERPEAAYAIHVAPGPFGGFGVRPGTTMAGANELYVTVHGEGGHGSQPHTAVDPVPAIVEIAGALQTMVTRSFDVFDPVVASVTQLSAGDAVNVIPDRASLGATVRTLSVAATERFETLATRVATGIAAAHGCTVEVRFEVNYPVTVSDPELTALTLDELRAEFGPQRAVVMENPLMGSEDFSFVLQEVPGTFIMLTCSPADVDLATAAFNHSPRVLFDDAILGDQAAALARLALRHVGA